MLRFAVEFGAHQIQAVTLQLNASPTSAIERKSDVVRSLYCTRFSRIRWSPAYKTNVRVALLVQLTLQCGVRLLRPN